MASLPQLLALLGSQGANVLLPPDYSVTGTPIAPPAEQGPDIEVRPMNSQVENPLYSLLPREDGIQQVRQAPPDTSMMPRTEASPQELARAKGYSNAPEHKGLFGMKGTLRDVVGFLGDAFARNSAYSDRRDKEKLSDAMIGYGTQDSQEQQALLARVAQVNPQEAQRLAQQFAQQQAQVRQEANLQRQLASDTQRNFLSKMKLAQGMMAQAQTPEAKLAIRSWLSDPQSSIDDIPDELIAASGINPYQQRQLQSGDRRQTEIERHNKVSEGIAQQRASRPPAGRAPSRPTASNVDAEVLAAIQAGTATPQQQKYFDNRLARGKSGNALKDLISGQPSGGRRVIRQGNSLFDATTKKYIGPAN